MYFDKLDQLQHVHGVFTLCWRFKGDGADPWTVRVNAFKSGDEKAIRGACAVSAKALAGLNWSKYMPGAVVPAISSKDTSCQPSHPVYALGNHIASSIKFAWLPNALSKTVHKSLHLLNTAGERDNEVRGAYSSKIRLDSVRTVLLVDDFCTRGSTLSDAGRAIKEAAPNVDIWGFTLGKTEKLSFAAEHGCNLDNTHVPAQWAAWWDNA